MTRWERILESGETEIVRESEEQVVIERNISLGRSEYFTRRFSCVFHGTEETVWIQPRENTARKCPRLRAASAALAADKLEITARRK